MNKSIIFEDFYYIISLVVPTGLFINFVYDLSKNLNSFDDKILMSTILTFVFFIWYVYNLLNVVKVIKNSNHTFSENGIDFDNFNIVFGSSIISYLYASIISIICFFSFLALSQFFVDPNINNSFNGYIIWFTMIIIISFILIYPHICFNLLKKNYRCMQSTSSFDSNI